MVPSPRLILIRFQQVGNQREGFRVQHGGGVAFRQNIAAFDLECDHQAEDLFIRMHEQVVFIGIDQEYAAGFEQETAPVQKQLAGSAEIQVQQMPVVNGSLAEHGRESAARKDQDIVRQIEIVSVGTVDEQSRRNFQGFGLLEQSFEHIG